MQRFYMIKKILVLSLYPPPQKGGEKIVITCNGTIGVPMVLNRAPSKIGVYFTVAPCFSAIRRIFQDHNLMIIFQMKGREKEGKIVELLL